jgi:hypothetical protein
MQCVCQIRRAFGVRRFIAAFERENTHFATDATNDIVAVGSPFTRSEGQQGGTARFGNLAIESDDESPHFQARRVYGTDIH